MRVLVTVSILFIVGCAKGEAFHAECNVPWVGAYQVTYPDGQSIKSDVWSCNDGCTKFSDVNDSNVTFNSCDNE